MSRRLQPRPRPPHQRKPLRQRRLQPRLRPSQDQRKLLLPRQPRPPKLPRNPRLTPALSVLRRLPQLYANALHHPSLHAFTDNTMLGPCCRRREESSWQNKVRTRHQKQIRARQTLNQENPQESCTKEGRVCQEGYTQESSRGSRRRRLRGSTFLTLFTIGCITNEERDWLRKGVHDTRWCCCILIAR